MNTAFKKNLRSTLPWLIALAILLGSGLAVLLMDGLERREALRLDFSFNSVTSLSQQTDRVLDKLDKKVHAYALSTPGQEDQALLGLLNRLAARSPQFSYSRENLVQNPLLVGRFSSSLSDEQVSPDSLILHCEQTGRTRVLNPVNFLEQRFDMDKQSFVLAGLAYEKAITEALLYLTLDSLPRVRLLDGHGEIQAQDTAYMESFLKGHHFEVSRINLLGGDKLDPTDLLMVLSPQKDLVEKELGQLLDFAKAGGNLLITSDYSDPDKLPRFFALYRLLGFAPKAGIVVAEGADSQAYIDNPLFLTPYMDMTEPTAALIGAAQTRLRLPGARAFDITAQSDGARVEPLLTSGLAYIKPLDKASQSLAYEKGEEQGQFSVALLSDIAHDNGQHTRSAVIGNSAILLDQWLHEVTYGAQFLLHLVNHLSHQQPIQLDIAPRSLVREQLALPSFFWPGLVLLALPLLILGLAVPLLLRRSRRK